MTHDHSHDHDHDATCGHDHGPPVVHSFHPAPNAMTAILIATSEEAALTPLRAPWGAPSGEIAVARVVRLLRRYAWSRILVVTAQSTQGQAIQQNVARHATPIFALDANPDTALHAGLQVALQVTRPPEGILIWTAEQPLTHANALHALLDSGIPQLARPDRAWARALVERHDPRSVGAPALLSREAGRLLLERAVPLTALINPEDAEVLVQRVAVDDPRMCVALNTAVRRMDHAPNPEG